LYHLRQQASSRVVMRPSVRSAAAIVLAGHLITLPGTAGAQGFLESLFGGGAKPRPEPIQRPPLPPPVYPTFGYRTPYYSPFRTQREPDEPLQSRHGSYRTLCVRLCDGFYWPISHAVSRSSFHRDANLCRASCGEEARLFYHRSTDGDVRDMVDLTGRTYARLPTAFRYRKTLVEGCKCKPEPWAQSELDRHRRYALTETVEQRQQRERDAAAGDKPDTARPLAEPEPGDDPDFSTRPVAAPEPVEQPRPRTRRAERLDGRPSPQKGPLRSAPLAKPASQPSIPGFFGSGGSGPKRWPGD
jgi:hypothetical protein